MTAPKGWVGWVATQPGTPMESTPWKRVTEGDCPSRVLKETERLAPRGCWVQVLWHLTRPKHTAGGMSPVRGKQGIIRKDSWEHRRADLLAAAAGRWVDLKEMWHAIGNGPRTSRLPERYRGFIARLVGEGKLRRRARKLPVMAGVRTHYEYTRA